MSEECKTRNNETKKNANNGGGINMKSPLYQLVAILGAAGMLGGGGYVSFSSSAEMMESQFENLNTKFEKVEDVVGEIRMQITPLVQRVSGLASTVQELRQELRAQSEKDHELDNRLIRLEVAR